MGLRCDWGMAVMSRTAPTRVRGDTTVAMLVGLREDVAVRFDTSTATVVLIHKHGRTVLGPASIALVTALELLTLGPVMAENLVESIHSQVDADQAAVDVARWARWDAALAPLLVHTVARNGRGLAHAVPKPGGRRFVGMAGPPPLPNDGQLRRTDRAITVLRAPGTFGLETVGGAYEVWGVDIKIADLLRRLTSTDAGLAYEVWARESGALSPVLGAFLAQLLALAAVVAPVGANGPDGATS